MRRTAIVAALVAAVVTLAVIAVVILGAEQKNDSVKGPSGQKAYCLENGWEYEPYSNTCRVPQ